MVCIGNQEQAPMDVLSDVPERRTGWLSGLRDPLIGSSLAKLHERSLAHAVNASRTVLAERAPPGAWRRLGGAAADNQRPSEPA
jgi:hypothetical protein